MDSVQKPVVYSQNGNQPRQFDIKELLGEHKEIFIIHNQERYVLRVTANDKLILTK